jgi:type II secretory pathway component PulJ
MTTRLKKVAGQGGNETGFTLIETVVALALLTVGLLSMAAVMAHSLRQMSGSTSDMVMTQKASEAIESVFTARDNRKLTWAQIRNVDGQGNDGGVFKDGPLPLKSPGADGLVNTADDDQEEIEEVTLAGRDNRLNTADDETVKLDTYTREIEIRDLSQGLRQIRVIVRYTGGDAVREFVLISYISTYA